MTTAARNAPMVPLLPYKWEQGEHLAVIGRTGSGKSTLASRLLWRRSHVISLVTKADPITSQLPRDTRNVLTRVSQIRDDDPRVRRYVIQPTPDTQQRECLAAIRKVWKDGGWTLYVDEAYYLEHELGLGKPLTQLLTQGRSGGITVVVGMQRPAWVSRFAVSEPTHVVSFAMEGRDAKTIGESTTRTIEPELMALPRHEALWYYRPENTWAPINLDMVEGRR